MDLRYPASGNPERKLIELYEVQQMAGTEIWDLYDEQGRKTGETWERSRAMEIPEGRYHIVCDVLIRHQDGTFLLTLRDPDKDVYPGCLEASAGGSALTGDDLLDFVNNKLFRTLKNLNVDTETQLKKAIVKTVFEKNLCSVKKI